MHGIGACSKALERLGIEHEIVDAVEIDKYAIKSFNAIHGTNFETQDITKWDKDIECDLIMHGSPCQDFSLAGKQAGGDIGSGTRSSLMYETIRIVGKLRPKYVIWENVKNVLSAKHKHNFDNYLTAMSSLGYTNYYQVLNAKDYGIPQNRERVFTVSILNEHFFNFPEGMTNDNKIQRLFNFSARQDCRVVYDAEGIAPTLVAGMGEGGGKVPMIIENFEFPPKQELKLRLKDMLEDEVDRKYYLSDEQIEKIKTSTFHTNARRIQEKDWCDTLCARDWKDPKCVEVKANRLFNIYGDDKGTSFAGNVWDKETISPTLTNMQGGNRQPMIMIKNATKKGYQEAYEGDSVNLAYPDSTTRRGRVGDQVAQTLQCNDNMGGVTNGIKKIEIPQTVKVRKYPVDTKKLVEVLRDAKIKQDLTNSRIAFELDVPITTVEHWFRRDESFAIPDEDVWWSIKNLLGIETTEFDESITTFEEKEGIYEKSNRYYYDDGIAPIITSASANEKIISNLKIRKLTPKECWRLMGFDDEDFEKCVHIGMSNTQLYKQAGNSIVANVLEAIFKNLIK